MAIAFPLEILKFKSIGDELNAFRDSHNLSYEDLDSEGNVPQPLVRKLPNASKVEKYPP